MKRLLPHFYRIITARGKMYSNIMLLSLLFLFFMLMGILIYLSGNYLSLKQKREKELASLYSWENLIRQFPNYPEVYYQAAIHAGNLKDNQKSVEYIEKALLLNPNMDEAKRLREELEKL